MTGQIALVKVYGHPADLICDTTQTVTAPAGREYKKGENDAQGVPG
jgi:hypothetical protein